MHLFFLKASPLMDSGRPLMQAPCFCLIIGRGTTKLLQALLQVGAGRLLPPAGLVFDIFPISAR
jgi:hypothetical protein